MTAQEIAELAGRLKPMQRRGLCSRPGVGDFSGAVFDHLFSLGLMDANFRPTELGYAVRQHFGVAE